MIEKKDIEWLAKLAKLQLDEDETEALRKDMEDIVGFAGTVAEAAADSEAYRGVIRKRLFPCKEEKTRCKVKS